MLRLYDMSVSGNCYKVRLLLAQLGTSYERIAIEPGPRDERPEGVRALNPHGRVPVLVLEDGRVLPESNAILWHLARGTPFLPEDPFARVEVLRWMFFEQNAIEPNLAVVRYLVAIANEADDYPESIRVRSAAGHQALAAMDAWLDGRRFFVGDTYSIADIALFAYTHAAQEGRFDLAPVGNVRDWLERVRSQPGWVPM